MLFVYNIVRLMLWIIPSSTDTQLCYQNQYMLCKLDIIFLDIKGAT